MLRVDLRLRPDPSSTPPSVPLPAAYQYYETVGQNWERAAFIKARPVAGDIADGRALPRASSPLSSGAAISIFRRSRRCAACGATCAPCMETTRRSAGATSSSVRAAFANASSRRKRSSSSSAGAIRAFAARARFRCSRRSPRPGTFRGKRASAFRTPMLFLRMIEHRLQMRNDEQTQILPRDGADLEDFARWSGFASAAAFEKEFAARTSQVRREAQKAFGGREVSDAFRRPRASRRSELRRERVSASGRGGRAWSRPGSRRPSAPRRATSRCARPWGCWSAISFEAFAATDDPDAAIAAFDRTFDRMAAPTELFSIFAGEREAAKLVRRHARLCAAPCGGDRAKAPSPRHLHRCAGAIGSSRRRGASPAGSRRASRPEPRMKTRSISCATRVARSGFIAGARFLGGGFDAGKSRRVLYGGRRSLAASGARHHAKGLRGRAWHGQRLAPRGDRHWAGSARAR